MTINLFPGRSARPRNSASALVAGCVCIAFTAPITHAQIDTLISQTLTGDATVTGDLISGRTITLGAGSSANLRRNISNPGYDHFYNRTMMGYRAVYDAPGSFYFEQRTLTGGSRYDLFQPPQGGSFPASLTGSTTFRGSGTDNTVADTTSSSAGMTLTQQLGIAPPLVLTNLSTPFRIERLNPQNVMASVNLTAEITRGTTNFSALGTSLASSYNDLFQLEIETYLDGQLQNQLSPSFGFNAGESGTKTHSLVGGVLTSFREGNPDFLRPYVEIRGRVRWINDQNQSIVFAGSEFYYSVLIPSPATAATLCLGGLTAMRRRRN